MAELPNIYCRMSMLICLWNSPCTQYGTPQYGTPQYGTPQYGTPQYGTPQNGTSQTQSLFLQYLKQNKPRFLHYLVHYHTVYGGGGGGEGTAVRGVLLNGCVLAVWRCTAVRGVLAVWRCTAVRGCTGCMEGYCCTGCTAVRGVLLYGVYC